MLSITRTLLLIIVLAASSAYAGSLTGRVVGVSDGDTITALDENRQQHKIRVAGIDAPEKKQAFGQRSKEHLSGLVFGREVDIVGDKRDRYGRTVAKVMVAAPDCTVPLCARTVDAGLRQIDVGLAWWYRKYAREQSPEDQSRYEASEANARHDRVGLWSQDSPVPPWEWRASRRGHAASRDAQPPGQ